MSPNMSLVTEHSHLILSYQPDDPDDYWTVHTAVFVAWSMCAKQSILQCLWLGVCKTIHTGLLQCLWPGPCVQNNPYRLTAVFVAWSMCAKKSILQSLWLGPCVQNNLLQGENQIYVFNTAPCPRLIFVHQLKQVI